MSDDFCYNPFIYRSDNIENITEAMVEFQKKIKCIKKNVKGQFDYASLDHLLYKVLPLLATCNINLEQSTFVYDGDIYLRTAITHITGEFKASFDYLYSKEYASTIPKDLEPNKGGKPKTTQQLAGGLQQTLGTIRSYQCRYAIASFLCIPVVAKDFDDSEYITDEQAQDLYDLAKGNENTLALLLEQLGVASDLEIKADDYDKAVEILKVLMKVP